MQQRQLRLGDILDDYCPRERRVTNHAVVAMIGDDVKQTRCTTCDAEHEYKHARVPRQRKKEMPSALFAHVAAGAPRRVTHDSASPNGSGGNHVDAVDHDHESETTEAAEVVEAMTESGSAPATDAVDADTMSASSGSNEPATEPVEAEPVESGGEPHDENKDAEDK